MRLLTAGVVMAGALINFGIVQTQSHNATAEDVSDVLLFLTTILFMVEYALSWLRKSSPPA